MKSSCESDSPPSTVIRTIMVGSRGEGGALVLVTGFCIAAVPGSLLIGNHLAF